MSAAVGDAPILLGRQAPHSKARNLAEQVRHPFAESMARGLRLRFKAGQHYRGCLVGQAAEVDRSSVLGSEGAGTGLERCTVGVPAGWADAKARDSAKEIGPSFAAGNEKGLG